MMRRANKKPYRPKHLSVSSVSLYTKCPAAWERNYVLRSGDLPTAPMLFGRAMAKTLEVMHNGGDPYQTFCEEYAKSVSVMAKLGSSLYIAADLGFELVRKYHGVMTPGEPEKMFKLPLPPELGIPLPVKGFMDLATPTEILEFKTSRGGWSQERADASRQAHVYAWAYEQLYGYRPQHVRFIVMSTRELKIDEYIVQPTDEGFADFCAEAMLMWDGYTRGQYERRCGKCDACKNKPLRADSFTMPAIS